MNRLSATKIIFLILLPCIFAASAGAQSFSRPPVKGQKKGIFGSVFRKSPGKSRTVKIREPRGAEKAKKKQEAKDRQLKRDYSNFVRNNQKRSIEIQTPQVQERMKQNIREADEKYKSKKKNSASRSRRAARKYK